MRIAITGGTGFVGLHLLDHAAAHGHAVRALVRRPQPERANVTWVDGALHCPNSLVDLVRGTDAVIHVAGVVNGTAAAFHAGNVVGTANMVEVARRVGIRRFVHVSSLSAREPGLSAYGASKRAAEEPVRASGLDWTIVRPAAIYGPRDTELLEMFRAARFGVLPLPSTGRVSLIAVEDLARLLLACLADPAPGGTYEPDDGVAGGWSQRDFARAIGAAVGRSVRTVRVPPLLLRLAARADMAVRGPRARLTADRAAYFAHPDWVAGVSTRPPAALWTPRVETRAGLAATAAWYRAAGWLR